LPDGIAALVEGMSADSVTLTLVNTDPSATRELLLQAGAFGEHRFTTVQTISAEDAVQVAGRHFRVRLDPTSQTKLKIGMERYVSQPTYSLP